LFSFFFSVLKKTQDQYILLNMSWYCFFWFYYLQLLVVMLLPWLFVITGFVTSVIKRVQIVKQELHILPAHLSFLVQCCEILCDVRVKRWYYLFFSLRFLITSLISDQSQLCRKILRQLWRYQHYNNLITISYCQSILQINWRLWFFNSDFLYINDKKTLKILINDVMRNRKEKNR
jgi:hypothetical protein